MLWLMWELIISRVQFQKKKKKIISRVLFKLNGPGL